MEYEKNINFIRDICSVLMGCRNIITASESIYLYRQYLLLGGRKFRKLESWCVDDSHMCKRCSL
jgi:hypothetical protein